jgi:hypothetical protein
MTRPEIIEKIIPAMILAPSAHNTQPWQFAVKDNMIDVYVDWSRHLAVSDPTARQFYIGIGCTITNAIVAASNQNYAISISYFPEGEGKEKPAARLALNAGSTDQYLSTLTPALSQRWCDRTVYDRRPLTPAEKTALPSHANPAIVFVEDRSTIEEIARLCGQGTARSLARSDFKQELSRWVRHNWTHRPDGMPGYAMLLPAPLSLIAPLMVRVAPIHKPQQKKVAEQMASASAIAIITSAMDTPQGWIEAGQTFERLWLEATAGGLAAGPTAAAIESGTEIREELKKVSRTAQEPQILLRLGHSHVSSHRATPRRSVAQCLR